MAPHHVNLHSQSLPRVARRRDVAGESARACEWSSGDHSEQAIEVVGGCGAGVVRRRLSVVPGTALEDDKFRASIGISATRQCKWHGPLAPHHVRSRSSSRVPLMFSSAAFLEPSLSDAACATRRDQLQQRWRSKSRQFRVESLTLFKERDHQKNGSGGSGLRSGADLYMCTERGSCRYK